LVLTSAKKGRQYDLGGMTVKINPVHEADALYLGTDGLIHLHEVKNTAKALRNKLKRHPKQLERLLKWQQADPNKREIRIVIGTEEGWTQIFAARKEEESALQILKRHQIPLTIGEYNLTLNSMNTLSNATVKKMIRLRKQNPDFSFDEFYRQMSTVPLAEKLLGVSLL
jgi:hypothetical protein